MSSELAIPDDFVHSALALEDAYLASDDPIRQSGFGGGEERWRAEREPILEAVDRDGTFVDVGCANGYLLECLVEWGRERGVELTPFGVDIGPRLIAVAKARMPESEANFDVANGWDWRPKRRFRYVYTLSDCVPEEMLGEYVRRLMANAVADGGRLILGSYGSRSRHISPEPVGDLLRSFGFEVAGNTTGGKPPVTRFAWADKN